MTDKLEVSTDAVILVFIYLFVFLSFHRNDFETRSKIIKNLHSPSIYVYARMKNMGNDFPNYLFFNPFSQYTQTRLSQTNKNIVLKDRFTFHYLCISKLIFLHSQNIYSKRLSMNSRLNVPFQILHVHGAT